MVAWKRPHPNLVGANTRAQSRIELLDAVIDGNKDGKTTEGVMNLWQYFVLKNARVDNAQYTITNSGFSLDFAASTPKQSITVTRTGDPVYTSDGVIGAGDIESPENEGMVIPLSAAANPGL